MDVNDTSDHISKKQLLTRIIELGFDGDFVTWIGSFLIDRKIQLVINGHDNKKKKIETKIPQGSPVSPIFFLIYISGVFTKISKISPIVISLFFVDDLDFIISGSSIKEIVRALLIVAKEVIEWGRQNAVTYDTAKIKAVFFSKSH